MSAQRARYRCSYAIPILLILMAFLVARRHGALGHATDTATKPTEGGGNPRILATDDLQRSLRLDTYKGRG
jgi:hypothetical protein